MIWHKSQVKTEGKSCSQNSFSDDYAKNSMQKTERNIFLKTVFSDDNAQNSGQAGGQISRKIETESLNKMHSHLVQAYIFQGMLSHQS